MLIIKSLLPLAALGALGALATPIEKRGGHARRLDTLTRRDNEGVCIIGKVFIADPKKAFEAFIKYGTNPTGLNALAYVELLKKCLEDGKNGDLSGGKKWECDEGEKCDWDEKHKDCNKDRHDGPDCDWHRECDKERHDGPDCDWHRRCDKHDDPKDCDEHCDWHSEVNGNRIEGNNRGNNNIGTDFNNGNNALNNGNNAINGNPLTGSGRPGLLGLGVSILRRGENWDHYDDCRGDESCDCEDRHDWEERKYKHHNDNWSSCDKHEDRKDCDDSCKWHDEEKLITVDGNRGTNNAGAEVNNNNNAAGTKAIDNGSKAVGAGNNDLTAGNNPITNTGVVRPGLLGLGLSILRRDDGEEWHHRDGCPKDDRCDCEDYDRNWDERKYKHHEEDWDRGCDRHEDRKDCDESCDWHSEIDKNSIEGGNKGANNVGTNLNNDGAKNLNNGVSSGNDAVKSGNNAVNNGNNAVNNGKNPLAAGTDAIQNNGIIRPVLGLGLSILRRDEEKEGHHRGDDRCECDDCRRNRRGEDKDEWENEHKDRKEDCHRKDCPGGGHCACEEEQDSWDDVNEWGDEVDGLSRLD